MVDWLKGAALSELLRDVWWAVPLLQTIHILAIAALFTSASMLNARLAGWMGRAEELSVAVVRLARPLWMGLAILAITGGTLVIAEPDRELGNQLFWTKMALVAIAVAVTAWELRKPRQGSYSELSAAQKRRGLSFALASTALWVLIIFCGRWIAYVEVFSG